MLIFNILWEYGKPSERVIEIVSNQKGNEAESKLDKYSKLYYAIFASVGKL